MQGKGSIHMRDIEHLTEADWQHLADIAVKTKPLIEHVLEQFTVREELIAERGYPETHSQMFDMEMEARRRIAARESA